MDRIENLEQTHRRVDSWGGDVAGMYWRCTAVPGALADNTTCQQPLCPLERNQGKGGGNNYSRVYRSGHFIF